MLLKLISSVLLFFLLCIQVRPCSVGEAGLHFANGFPPILLSVVMLSQLLVFYVESVGLGSNCLGATRRGVLLFVSG